jgi:hypothetical protein
MVMCVCVCVTTKECVQAFGLLAFLRVNCGRISARRLRFCLVNLGSNQFAKRNHKFVCAALPVCGQTAVLDDATRTGVPLQRRFDHHPSLGRLGTSDGSRWSRRFEFTG